LYYWQLIIANINKMAIEKRQLKLMEEVAVLTIQGGFAGRAQTPLLEMRFPVTFTAAPSHNALRAWSGIV